MSNESSDAFKIRRAPNGKSYVWGKRNCPLSGIRSVCLSHDQAARSLQLLQTEASTQF